MSPQRDAGARQDYTLYGKLCACGADYCGQCIKLPSQRKLRFSKGDLCEFRPAKMAEAHRDQQEGSRYLLWPIAIGFRVSAGNECCKQVG